MIYEFIVANGQLTSLHRDELIRRRGFAEATVAACRFISGGQHMLDLEKKLLAFPQEDLLETGVFVANAKGIGISPILLEDRIIIPYLDKNNRCYFIRPHKLGLKGAGIEIYQKKNINGKSLVLTEGEFKAAACVELGYPCIAVPGISSFSTTHLHRLVKLLIDESVRDVFIVFDNEVKDDEAKYPQRFKRDPKDRYDTPYYAVVMAKALEKEGFNTFIGTLPAAWMVDGKIDIDGALAQDKTTDDFKAVLQAAQTWKEYLKDLPAPAVKEINRKLARKFFRNHIHKEFNAYHAVRQSGKSEVSVPISNFILKVKSTTVSPAGMTRDIVFIQDHSPMRTIQITADEVADVHKFKVFCVNSGDYLWWGTGEDLAAIWAPEFLEGDGRIINERPHIGWDAPDKTWVYGNVGIREVV